MSSILKALEKVEESQNPRRHGGTGGMARGREPRPAWVIPAWALGGAALAALVTYAIMGGFSPAAAPVPQQADIVEPAPVAIAPLDPVPEPHASSIAAPLPASVQQSVAVPAPKPAPVSIPASAAKVVRNPAPAAGQPAEFLPSDAQADLPGETVLPFETQELAPEKPRQEVRVTGIAWQKDGTSSVAMVNGRPVRKGGVVDGFKVEQIDEDSVRFSGSKGILVVPLGGGE